MSVDVEGAVAENHLQRYPKDDADKKGKEVDIGSFRDMVIDFVAGCVSGCAGIVVGQPFDTVKVRLQTQDVPTAASSAVAAASPSASTASASSYKRPPPPPPQVAYKGAIGCTVETVSKEGFRALYKGMGAPLVSATIVNAITFGAYAQSQRALTAYGFMDDRRGQGGDGHNSGSKSGSDGSSSSGDRREQTLEAGRSMDLVWSFLGGSFAGMCQTVVTIPTDNIKVKLQVQVGAPGSSKLAFEGPIDCAFKLLKADGIGALFRAAPVTVTRDTPSCGIYFAAYEATKECLARRWGLGEQASAFGAGGFAGAVSWLVIYPLDVVKSVQMASTNPLDPSTRSIAACFRHVYNSAGGGVPGVRRFFRGVGATMARAVPVNAAVFPTFEWTAKVLNQAFPLE